MKMESMMAKKLKLPKKVAGYRVPKSMRKSKLLSSMLNNPLGRDVVANALTAGARRRGCRACENRKEIGTGREEGAKKGLRQPAWRCRSR